MISSFEKYLAKHPKLIETISLAPNIRLNNIIAIPAYNEPNLLNTLQSIKNNKTTKYPTEVIVLINNSLNTLQAIYEQNIKTYNETVNWAKTNSTQHLTFHVLFYPSMPKKHAGVGLARKIIMDEAVTRFSLINNPNGIIISLDADTTIDDNYLFEIENSFLRNNKLNTVLPWFEHNYTEEPTEIKNAIKQYELYLRYFKLALNFTKFPFAYHTIGSAFAVKAMAYIKQGGMNKKQGGEDFYFLQKVFKLGNTKEIKHVAVFPSGRISDRVPFGTGPAVQKIINEGELCTYHPKYFKYLKSFFDQTDKIYHTKNTELSDFYNSLNNSIKEFIQYNVFENKITEIQNNSSNEITFTKRFFQWFDAFMIIKYLNLNHPEKKRIPISAAAQNFLETIGYNKTTANNIDKLLTIFKEIDRKQI